MSLFRSVTDPHLHRTFFFSFVHTVHSAHFTQLLARSQFCFNISSLRSFWVSAVNVIPYTETKRIPGYRCASFHLFLKRWKKISWNSKSEHSRVNSWREWETDRRLISRVWHLLFIFLWERKNCDNDIQYFLSAKQRSLQRTTKIGIRSIDERTKYDDIDNNSICFQIAKEILVFLETA